jgi:hypothetical protein
MAEVARVPAALATVRPLVVVNIISAVILEVPAPTAAVE